MLDLGIIRSVFPDLLNGVALSIKLSLLILLFGLLLALPVAFARNATSPALRHASRLYILFFRGVPAIIQVFLVYYGLGQFQAVRSSILWPVLRDPFWCLIIALSLNGSAYTGELLAGAMRAVPRGLVEAARALGLSQARTLQTVVVPLAVRAALPAYSNEVILTVKATSLASTITLLDVTGAAKLAASQTYAPYEVFIAAGVIYFVLTYSLSYGLRQLESALAVESRH
ncbi:ABC transporter permease [Bosea sp. NPDC055332]